MLVASPGNADVRGWGRAAGNVKEPISLNWNSKPYVHCTSSYFDNHTS